MKPITVIGGGLAGLTLGIGLRRKGVPVTIWEAGHYPRHRVCGEFISGRGQDALARLGLSDLFQRTGAVLARTATFFLGNLQSPVRPLPQPALCLSRFEMDAALAREFCALGGELRAGQRWKKDAIAESVIWANGRCRRTTERGCRWFGLKVHARNVASAADLEMHGSADGYVGITRLGDGVFNVCGLFRRPVTSRGSHRKEEARHFESSAGFQPAVSPISNRQGFRTASAAKSFAQPARCKPAIQQVGNLRYEGSNTPPSWQNVLRGAPGTPLRQRMAEAIFDENTFCSVAGLPLLPQRARDHAECTIGDALTMIPPVTGNGMSMAFEAAELAIAPIAAYSGGEISWFRATRTLAHACDSSFNCRLAWAQWLQWMMFASALRRGLGRIVLNSDLVWNVMFAKTR